MLISELHKLLHADLFMKIRRSINFLSQLCEVCLSYTQNMIKEQYFHINRSFLVWKIFRPAATPVIRHAHAFSCWIDVVRNLFNNHVIKQPSGLQMVSNALAKHYKSEIVFSRCAWIFFFFSSKG